MIMGVIVALAVVSALAEFTTFPPIINWAVGIAAGYLLGNVVGGRKKKRDDIDKGS
jgi:uncharacterized protein YqfA (UPF0365 family)